MRDIERAAAFDGVENAQHRLPQPPGQLLVIRDGGQLREMPVAEPEHFGLRRARLDRRPRHHHDELEQQALEQFAPFRTRAVDVEENQVDDPRGLFPVAALDRGQQRRLFIKIKFPDAIVGLARIDRHGRKIIRGF